MGVFLLLAAYGALNAKAVEAQEYVRLDDSNAAPPFSANVSTPERNADSFQPQFLRRDSDSTPEVRRTFASSSTMANSLLSPEPVPSPKGYTRTTRTNTTWELALGVDWFRFRSSIFNASAIGTKTSVAYFRKDWIGIEGVVSTAFAPQIYVQEHVKLLTYGAGPKIVWRRGTWDPWMHAILGGAHEFPQTAAGSKNGLGVEMGGGVDYHFLDHLSGRLEGNYLLSRFFSQTQSNFQLAAGVVFNF
jgi:hypothetical protein